MNVANFHLIFHEVCTLSCVGMRLFCCLSNEKSTGKLSHISSFHFNFVLVTKQSLFCLFYVRVLYDSVKVFEGSPETAV